MDDQITDERRREAYRNAASNRLAFGHEAHRVQSPTSGARHPCRCSRGRDHVGERVRTAPVREVTDDFTKHDWLCPFHGLAVIRTSRRTGRRYVGCPVCYSFARPANPPPMALSTDRTATLRRLVAATAPLLGGGAGV